MKSLDKKKGIKDFSGHNYYENDYDKPKELSDCCNAEVATANSGLAGETNYYICTKCHNDCDVITEPKKIDCWEKELDILFSNKVLLGYEPPIISLKQFIKQLLTQQRTEILEEFKKGTYIISYFEDKLEEARTEVKRELLEEIKTRIDTCGGFEDDGGNLCHYDSEILEWVNDLLNKKL